jgi:hypothetical protein
MRTPSPRWLAGAAIGLVAGPMAIDFAINDRQRPFVYLASDAFYYMTVGWNFAHRGVLGYDQVRASNGYHPLWQLIECVLFLFHLPDLASIALVLFTSTALLCASFWLFAKAMTREGKLSPLFPILPLGIFGLIMAPYYVHQIPPNPSFTAPLFGSLWTHIDGMESCVTVFFYALAAWLYVREPERTRRAAAWFGLTLALLTLARLDHGLFAAMLFLGLAIRARKQPVTVAACALFFAAPVLVYLIINKLAFGSALPLSGVLKSTFPHASYSNWSRIVTTLKHPLNTSAWRMYRVAQIVIPVLFVPLTLLLRRRDRFAEVLKLSGPAVILLAAYDLLFVDLPSHGHWYFPVSIVFVSLVVMRVIGERPSGLGAWLVAGTATVLCLYSFFSINRRFNYNTFYSDFFFNEAPKIREFYAGKKVGIVEVDDGIIAFSTHVPCMSGSGLNLDREAFDAYRRRELYRVAFARGYDRVASLAYVNERPIKSLSPDVLGAFTSALGYSPSYKFQIDYQSSDFIIAKGELK